KAEVPDFLTVEEAARILRLGRTAAYALARQWRETDGRDGLPVVTVGRLLRVPRAALEGMSGGPLTGTGDPARLKERQRRAEPTPAPPTPAPTARRRGGKRRSGQPSPDQATLPFSS